ncbi:sugar-binding transcriptional regulator [Agrobacterium larrymoorei]|uniref:Sugar-binding transcriptional regulator n=1 Tax=Agrobacterium larrymoorei TaxID=160699 RepID=A0AAF0KG70_9HYPH|nr:sugar-binding transcriptional regulator [Agrobacterium larrymoorei]WHA44053.1 sugar-binding transcriptional regulator [Agrobacterium larrymoorei]
MPYQQSMVRASWLYHVEGLTQAQIAERMSLTRRRVNELLAAALDQGVVRISFNSPLMENVELEAALRDRYDLANVVVVPTPEDESQISTAIGRGTAMFLDRLIQANEPAALGVGWGATLRETANHITPANIPQIKVRSMMGGLTRGSEINTFEIVRRFAQMLKAECHYLAAPIYVDSPASQAAILTQPFFADLLADATAVDISILSVGDVSSKSLQVRYGLPAETDIGELVALGAVGDILGRYLDKDGCEINHPLNRQVISPSIEDYRKISTRIIASGGEHKTKILRSCLTAGLATILITDSDNAVALLET